MAGSSLAVDHEEPGSRCAARCRAGDSVVEERPRLGRQGVEEGVHARGVPVLEEGQHRPGPGPGVGGRAGRPSSARATAARSRGVGHEVEVPGEEAPARAPGSTTARPAVSAERVRAGREVPDQLPRLRVASERQHDADPLRQRRARRGPARPGPSPTLTAMTDGRPAPHGRVRGEALERRRATIRASSGRSRWARRAGRSGTATANPARARRSAVQASRGSRLPVGREAVDQDEPGPRARAFGRAGARGPAAMASGRARPSRGSTTGGGVRARQPGVPALGQELDEEAEPGHARRGRGSPPGPRGG